MTHFGNHVSPDERGIMSRINEAKPLTQAVTLLAGVTP